MAGGGRNYTREEVEEILRRASERTVSEDGGEGLRHDELIAAAREAGIDVGAVEHAAGELATQREEQRWVEQYKARRRARFTSHFLTWLIVNAGLFLINVLSGGAWWFFWPLLMWGIAVALHGASALREPTPEKVERIARHERRKIEAERRRAARRAARDELRRKIHEARTRRGSAEREFERAVESGVTALLEVVAKKIEQATRPIDRGPLADTEFNRYAERRRREDGGAGRARATPPEEAGRGPRVRVGDQAVDREARTAEVEEEEERPVPPPSTRARRT